MEILVCHMLREGENAVLCGKPFEGLLLARNWEEVTCSACLQAKDHNEGSRQTPNETEKVSGTTRTVGPREDCGRPIPQDLLVYSVEHLAKRLGYTVKGIYKHVSEAHWPSHIPKPFKLGNRLAWRPADVENWLEWKAQEAQAAMSPSDEMATMDDRQDLTAAITRCAEELKRLADHQALLLKTHESLLKALEELPMKTSDRQGKSSRKNQGTRAKREINRHPTSLPADQAALDNQDEDEGPSAYRFWQDLPPRTRKVLASRFWNRSYVELWGDSPWMPGKEEIEALAQATQNQFRAIRSLGAKTLRDIASALKFSNFIDDEKLWFAQRKW